MSKLFVFLVCFIHTIYSNKNWFLHQKHKIKNTPDNRVTSSQLPLSVKSRWILDTSGKRVKLTCANWYGAEELGYVVGGLQWSSIDTISSLIASTGFNCVRLPFSLELIDKNPKINQTKIKQEPSLYGSNALTVLDKVISTLTQDRIMVILDNHVSQAGWCCSNNDGNGLWYTNDYSQDKWIQLWGVIVNRYKNNKYVIGCDLRNELRSDTVNGKHLSPSWGNNDKDTDWRLAAITVSNSILAINPNLLMFIEGINYALNLNGVYSHPILNSDLTVSGKIVYSAHDYSWSQSVTNYDSFQKTMGDNWGYILAQNKTYTAPVWLGEYGECHSSTGGCLKSNWWSYIREYLTNADIDWGYWAIDGTESEGQGRTYGSEETFGVLNMTWNGYANIELVNDLQKIMNATQHP